MKRLKYLLRVVGINLIILLILVISINIISALILSQSSALNKPLPQFQSREFPSVADQAKADQIYYEQTLLKSTYEPYIGWSRKEATGKHVTINQEGDRTHTHYIDDNVELKQIAIFGGSTIWGSGCSNHETIPAYLDSLNLNWKVNNYGEFGFKSRQGLARLVNLYLQAKHFDLVIFYDGVNEIGSCQKQYQALDHKRTAMFRAKIEGTVEQTNPVREFLDFTLIRFTRSYVNSLRSKKDFTNKNFGHLYNCEPNSDKAKSIAKALVLNWKLTHKIVNSHGGKFIAILQPNAFIGKPNIAYYEQSEHYRAYFKQSYQAVYTEIKRIIAIEKIPWIFDLTDELDGTTPFYLDECHLNEAGNLKIAKKIQLISKEVIE